MRLPSGEICGSEANCRLKMSDALRRSGLSWASAGKRRVKSREIANNICKRVSRRMVSSTKAYIAYTAYSHFVTAQHGANGFGGSEIANFGTPVDLRARESVISFGQCWAGFVVFVHAGAHSVPRVRFAACAHGSAGYQESECPRRPTGDS